MTSAADWFEDAFFEGPEQGSVDGGTTSSGDLWHRVSSRWGHSMHAMCSYYGMFPAKLAHYFIQRYSEPGGVVLDPFSGRGTTALQGRVMRRRVICNDLNPLAYVLTRAKADPPTWTSANSLVDELEIAYRKENPKALDVAPEVRMLYHDNTLLQLVFIRKRLLAKPMSSWTREEVMLAGALAGIMHGGWRRDGSSQYLSVSMPNTFSMAPSYVEKFIREKNLKKLDQNVFERLRDKLARLYVDDITGPAGRTHQLDASRLMCGRRIRAASIDLIVTSPPYLRVVNYGASNWIRIWLLGVDHVSRDQGAGRKTLDGALDHRHTYDSYKAFMLRTLMGMQRVMKRDGVAVVVIGDVAVPGKNPLPLAAKVWADIEAQTHLRLVELIEDDLPTQNKVSRIWGDSKGQATNRDCILVLARRDGAPLHGRSVEWAEAYRDAGPDAAHERLRSLRVANP